MDKTKVLIIDFDKKVRKDLEEMVQADALLELIGVAENGYEAQTMIERRKPDVIIMDIVIPGLDGMSILRTLSAEWTASDFPAVFVTTAVCSERIIRESFRLGVQYFVLKPYTPKDLIYTIKQMVSCSGQMDIVRYAAGYAKQPDALDQSVAISGLLRDIGMPAHVKGFAYLTRALELSMTNSEALKQITKWLYPAVASEFDTTASSVERAIRNAIEIAWTRGTLERKNHIFGGTINPLKGKPTNSEFMAMAIHYLRLDRKKCG